MAVQHSQLTGDLVHEPKGADQALANLTLFSKGDGTTEWRSPTINDLSFVEQPLSPPVINPLDPDVVLDGTLLSAVTDGVLQDAITLTEENKNIKELFVAIQRNQDNLDKLVGNCENINQTILAIQAALRTLGFTIDV